MLTQLLRDESAATMVEYGIMITLIAAASFVVVSAIGGSTSGEFSGVSSAL